MSSELIVKLRSLAPYSVIEQGEHLAALDCVSECSRSAGGVTGVVRDDQGSDNSVTVQILAGNRLEARCSCSPPELMEEQWCAHAVALLVRAAELGFLESGAGFAPREATFHLPSVTSGDFARVITELRGEQSTHQTPIRYQPRVDFVLDVSSDRLGVQVRFDKVVQHPLPLEQLGSSGRALDNVVLRVLEEEGAWDEQRELWYVNSSRGIEIVLGLLTEYRENIRSLHGGKAVRFSAEEIDAELIIEWQDSSLELHMNWLPGGGEQRVPKQQELLGSGPYWVVLNNCIYRLSLDAARIASLFRHSAGTTLSIAQSAPIVEALLQHELPVRHVTVSNPDLQPKPLVRAPVPHLRMERTDDVSGHFDSGSLCIRAVLEFEYPDPSRATERVVYLPHREREAEHIQYLKLAGFELQSSGNAPVFNASREKALEIISRGEKQFGSGWKVEGFNECKQGVRFVNLGLHLALSPRDASSAGNAAYECRVTLTQNSATIPISTLFKRSHSDWDQWIQLDNGAYAQVPGGSLRQLKTTLGMLDPNYRLANTIRAELSTAQAVGLCRLEDPRFHINLDKSLVALAGKLESFNGITALSAVKGFKGDLRSYQAEGVGWLNFLAEMNLDGILADEMGLGKTVQTLALIQHLKTKRGSGDKSLPSLIVAPTSVVTNWVHEASRFTPNLKVLLLHGPDRRKLFSKCAEHDLVITSYALLRVDRFELERIQWLYLILDEAQHIKNPEAATTTAAKALKSRRRLALSGTPTENRPLELWSIFDYLMPGYLGSLEFFRTHVEKPILEEGTDTPAAKLLVRKTRLFVLRRKKKEVEKDLPDKIESDVYVPMTDRQREVYRQFLQEVRPSVFDLVERKGIRAASISILSALLRLRQICNHPNSIEGLGSGELLDSGKFERLKELVEEALASGRKILLFSQFREMLAIIRSWLNEQGVSYLYLDGATKRRQDLIDRFNRDDSVRLFLISLKAGGTGLNLASADTVILYDPWWNPAVENQAIDRAHRIGQHRAVNVYRLITEGSVEQHIMDLKARKQKIVEALIGEHTGSLLKLSRAELEQLFATPSF